VAHWIFSFKYYKIGVVLKFATVRKVVPGSVIQSFKRVNFIFIAFSLFFSIATAYVYYLSKVATWVDGNTDLYLKYDFIYGILKMIVGLLLFMTAVFLIIGIFKIYKIAKTDNQVATQVFNNGQLLFHFGTAMFVSSVLVLYGFYFYYRLHPNPSRYQLYAEMKSISNVFSMFGQLCMLGILWPLTRK
jgi:hypothetical protein